MENLNHKLLRNILDDKDNKKLPCKSCGDLLAQYDIIVSHLDHLIKNRFSSHELAQWINAVNYYVTLKDKCTLYGYPVRSLVYVELGTSIGNELSYEHIAVVIAEGNDKAFIVPCSSSENALKKIDKSDTDYVKGTVECGFPKETTVFIKEARWISKSRIKSSYKTKVSPELFDEIYRKVFNSTFKSKSLEIEKAKKKIGELQNRNDELMRIITTQQFEIDAIAEKLKNVERERDEYCDILDIATSK